MLNFTGTAAWRASRRCFCRPVLLLSAPAVIAALWMCPTLIGGARATATGQSAAHVSLRPKRVAVPPRSMTGWTVCSFARRRSGTEISQVQALRMRCSQAATAIGHAQVVLTPGGPMFTVGGYACAARNLEPVTPAPSQLPELVRCSGRHHREFRFIWTWR